MHEQQAIGRAFRIGQKRHVYVYRLIAAKTFEEAVQNQALFKLQLSSRVVDKKNPLRHAKKGVRQYIFPLKEPKQESLEPFKDKDPRVLDRILVEQEE